MSHINYNLTNDQQRLLNMYINQYNQTNSHIDRLLDMLDEIRGNIMNVISSTQPRRTRMTRHSRNSNSHINRFINQIINDGENSYIHYDYSRPINPQIYNQTRIFNDTNSLFNDTNSSNSLFSNTRLFNDNILLRNSNRRAENSNDLADFLTNFLNTNVVVRPTNEEIQNASRIVRYSNIENPLSESCPISLEQFQPDQMVRQIIHCGHLFSDSYFQEWFNNNVRCPVCRYDIREYRNRHNRSSLNNTSESNEIQSSNSTLLEQTTQPSIIEDDVENENLENENLENENLENENLEQQNNNSFTNFNVFRNPNSNQIEHVMFDISNNELSNDIVNNVTYRLFQSILRPQTNNQSINRTQTDDVFLIDPSNNLLIYETILRPNTNTRNNTR